MCTRGERACSQDKKDSSVLPTFAFTRPAPTHNQQTFPHLSVCGGGGEGGGRVAVALPGIVPRMENVGVGNLSNTLDCSKNFTPLITRPQSSRAFQGIWKLPEQ